MAGTASGRGETPEDVEPSPSAPKRRKRKRKKRREQAPPLDADGRERPAFILDFPDDPELRRLTAAFEAGDYARVRSEAPALAERSESEAVRAAARELLRRIEPDPLLRYLLLAAVALLVFLALWAYFGRGR